jgi:5'-nucleotidase (lipoprotein e(P4) family)
MKPRLPCLLIVTLMTVTACATRPAPVAAPAARAAIPSGLHWYLTAAEKPALYEQIYRFAGDRILQLVAGRERGSWAVIADADETLLDNAEYNLMLARSGQKYSEPTWQAWVRLRHSIALPGSRAFIDRVLAAGGQVVVVTNRAEAICEDTRANLRSENLRVTAVLCAPQDPATGKLLSDKNPRFEAVQNGTAAAGLPALQVLAWVGDNIKDFPGRSQTNSAPLAEFGEHLFMLPNPVYGSWESNPVP